MAIGRKIMAYILTTASNNVVHIGHSAMKVHTTAKGNVFMGYKQLWAEQQLRRSTSLGSVDNIFMGHNTGFTTGDYNVNR